MERDVMSVLRFFIVKTNRVILFCNSLIFNVLTNYNKLLKKFCLKLIRNLKKRSYICGI